MSVIANKVRERSDRLLWAEYAPGFRIRVRHLTTSEILRLEDQARKQEWDRRTRQKSEELDREKMARLMAERVIADWRLDGDTLRSLLDLDEYPEGSVPYSAEDCAALLTHNLDVYVYVRGVCQDLALFEEARKAEAAKNSMPSPGADSARAEAVAP